MKQFLLFLKIFTFQLLGLQSVFAATNPFEVTQATPFQTMVAGSSQAVHFTLSSSAPKDKAVVVTCSLRRH